MTKKTIKTEFEYANAPLDPTWRFITSTQWKYCESFDQSGGYFLAIKNPDGEIVKEEFYVSASGRAKAYGRFVNKYISPTPKDIEAALPSQGNEEWITVTPEEILATAEPLVINIQSLVDDVSGDLAELILTINHHMVEGLAAHDRGERDAFMEHSRLADVAEALLVASVGDKDEAERLKSVGFDLLRKTK